MAEKPVVSIVTGSSRGAGKGIAVALGSHGCIVYVTGRSEKEGDGEVPGTIYATAREVTVSGVSAPPCLPRGLWFEVRGWTSPALRPHWTPTLECL